MDINDALLPRRNQLIAANAAEYGDRAGELNWVDDPRAVEAESERALYLARLGISRSAPCRGTKPYLGLLSPGCRICTEGGWSCLFINGRCNCRCFYCPTAQDEVDEPTTNGITFARAEDYADYVKHFGFTGVSISGGEPLLTVNRTRSYIEALRRRLGDDLHIWLYTNGTLLTRKYLLTLRDAGLNEIRFNISAANYNLKKAEMAVDLIRCVAIEIPAIPEDRDRLAGLLPVMRDMGIDHLNLHQLRLTPYNCVRLQPRGYTFLHGEKVTVLESELTALALMADAHEKGIGLPINYCSFVYKNRYQGVATRRRNAPFIQKKYESVTENGFIRTLSLTGDPVTISRQAGRLAQAGVEAGQWYLTDRQDRLYLHPRHLTLVTEKAGELAVSYAAAVIRPHLSYRFAFKEVNLSPNARLYVEKKAHDQALKLNAGERTFFDRRLAGSEPYTSKLKMPTLSQLAEYEWIRPGLQDYF